MQEHLDLILEYNMTPLEAKAYKLALMWQELAKKHFPNYSVMTIKKKGDPRQSLVFKYCYKLARETLNQIDDKDYKLYITAQLSVLKEIKHGDVHALIEPNCLVGDKAWIRWKMWKRNYDKVHKKVTMIDDITPEDRILASLTKTQKFFEEQYGHTPSFEEICESVQNKKMIRWAIFSKVAPYYILLSPFIKKCLEGKSFEEVFKFDLSVYSSAITSSVEKTFKEMFSHEFQPTP